MELMTSNVIISEVMLLCMSY